MLLCQDEQLTNVSESKCSLNNSVTIEANGFTLNHSVEP